VVHYFVFWNSLFRISKTPNWTFLNNFLSAELTILPDIRQLFIHPSVSLSMYICVCVCIYVYIHTSIYVYIYTHIHTYICVYMSIYPSTCLSTCLSTIYILINLLYLSTYLFTILFPSCNPTLKCRFIWRKHAWESVEASLERRSLTCTRLRHPTVEGHGYLADSWLENTSLTV